MSSQSLKSCGGLNKTSFANKRRKRNEAGISSVTTITGYFTSSANETSSNSSDDKCKDVKDIELVANGKRKSLVGFDESFDLFVCKKEVDQLKLEEEKKCEEDCEKVKRGRSCTSEETDERWSSCLKWNICPVCYEETRDWRHVKDCFMEQALHGPSVDALLSAHHQYVTCRLSLGLPLPTKLYDPVFKDHLTSGIGNGNLVSPRKSSVEFGSPRKSSVEFGSPRKSSVAFGSPRKSSVAFGSSLKWKGNPKKAKYILLRRSKEERESILSQKIAIILMDIAGRNENSRMTPPNMAQEDSVYIRSIRKMECPLWIMAQTVDHCKLEDLYTSGLSPFIEAPRKSPQPHLKEPNSEDVSREDTVSPVKLCSFSNELTSTSNSQPTTSNEVLEMDTEESNHSCVSDTMENSRKPSDLDAASACHGLQEVCSFDNRSSLTSNFQPTTCNEVLEMDTEESNNSFVSETMANSRKASDLDAGSGCHRLENDWGTLFVSSQLSDLSITCNQAVIPAHSLVLYVRCPKFYDFVVSNSTVVNGHFNFKWEISDVVGKTFLKFLYSGKEDLTGLTDEELMRLKEICSKFLVERLRCQVDAALSSSQVVPLGDVHPCTTRLASISPVRTHTILSSVGNNHRPPHFPQVSPVRNLNSSKSSVKRLTKLVENAEEGEDLTASRENDGDSVDAFSLCSVTTEEIDRDKIDCEKELETRNDSCDSDASTLPVPSVGSPGPTSEGLAHLTPLDDTPPPFVFLSSPSRPAVCSPGPTSEDLAHLTPLDDTPPPFVFLSSPSTPARHTPTSPLHPVLGLSPPDNHPTDCPNTTSPSALSPRLGTPLAICDTSLTDPPSEHFPVAGTTRNSLTDHFKDDTFFTDECLLDLIDCEEGTSGKTEARPMSTPSCRPSQSTLLTPTAQVIVSDKVTPMPDYTGLISPHLKEQLKRYGLKQDMEKGKAKMLLRYIYDQIHPMIPTKSLINSREAEEVPVQTDISADTCLQSMDEHIISSSSSSDSGNSEARESECYISGSDDDTVNDHDTKSLLSGADLLTAVSSLIKDNAQLYESVLRYTPVWVEKVHQALKENNVKCKMADLMDVLDQLCVTSRIKKKDRSKVKRRKK